MGLVSDARMYAIAAHTAVKQVRKYTGDPYWYHPSHVAQLVEDVGGSLEMIAAAWLHDVVEDTGITFSDIEQFFGSTVCGYVQAITNVESAWDRSSRASANKLHLSNQCSQAKTIKLADIISNLSTVEKHDPDFAKIYMKEKKDLLGVLSEGNHILLQKAWRIIND